MYLSIARVAGLKSPANCNLRTDVGSASLLKAAKSHGVNEARRLR